LAAIRCCQQLQQQLDRWEAPQRPAQPPQQQMRVPHRRTGPLHVRLLPQWLQLGSLLARSSQGQWRVRQAAVLKAGEPPPGFEQPGRLQLLRCLASRTPHRHLHCHHRRVLASSLRLQQLSRRRRRQCCQLAAASGRTTLAERWTCWEK
jgi:hypothetical protein